MKLLFIGGTGFISTAVTQLALAQGHAVYHLNRGLHHDAPPQVHQLTANIHHADEVNAALRGLKFDVVVDWIAYNSIRH